MNRMIRHLQREGDLSEETLKQLYRRLSKETHPDLTGKDGKTFVELKTLYEEALGLLRSGSIEPEIKEPSPTEEELRIKLLKTLYIYSVKFRGQYSEGLLNTLIESAKSYNRELYKTLLSYREHIFIPFSRLKPQADFYWTHRVFIQTIPQLAWYFNFDSIIYKRICRSYIKELKSRAENLTNRDFKEIFLFLASWLKEEMEKEKVIILKN